MGNRQAYSSDISKLDQEAFLDLACQLSPENLTCDGELSRSQVHRKLTLLKKDWFNLEQKVGRKVTEEEVWRFAR